MTMDTNTSNDFTCLDAQASWNDLAQMDYRETIDPDCGNVTVDLEPKE